MADSSEGQSDLHQQQRLAYELGIGSAERHTLPLLRSGQAEMQRAGTFIDCLGFFQESAQGVRS